MIFKVTSPLLPLLLLGLSFSSFGNAQQTVADIVTASENHEILLDLVQRLGLDLLLSAPALNSTLFAPTNEAFAFAIPDKFLEERYQAHLAEIVGYHLTAGMVKSEDLKALNQQQLLMHSGEYTTVTSVGPTDTAVVMINEATITTPDIIADNGVVHVIDEVLLPEFVQMDVVDVLLQNPDLTILHSLVEAAGLIEALKTPGPFTLYAPSDEAFAILTNSTVDHLLSPAGQLDLQFILSYHVVVGVNLQGDEETALETLTGTAITLSPPKEAGMPGAVVEDAKANMTDAVKNMTGTMQNMTNDAMANMMESIYTTINGGEANIIVNDILVNNGVIHVIDAVLVPPDSYLEQVAKEAAEAAAANVVDTVTEAVGSAPPVPPEGVGSAPPGVGSAPPGVGSAPPGLPEGPPDGTPPVPGTGGPDVSALAERTPPGDIP